MVERKESEWRNVKKNIEILEENHAAAEISKTRHKEIRAIAAQKVIEAVFPAGCRTPWCVDLSNSGSCQKCGATVDNIEWENPGAGWAINPTGGMQCQRRGHHACWNCVMGEGALRRLDIQEESFQVVREQVFEAKLGTLKEDLGRCTD